MIALRPGGRACRLVKVGDTFLGLTAKQRVCVKAVLLTIAITASSAATADAWFVGPKPGECTRLPGTTVDGDFARLKAEWGNALEVLAEPHTKDGTRFFFVVAHAPNGVRYPFMVGDSKAVCAGGAAATPKGQAITPAPSAKARPANPVPTRTWSYKPFSITSTKLNKSLSGVELEQKLMCRKNTENMAFIMSLLRDYDRLGTTEDESASMVSFRGQQEGKPVDVSLVTEPRERRLMYVAVNGQPVLGCKL